MRPDRPETLAAKVAAALDRIARAERVLRQAAATEAGLTPLQVDLLATIADGQPPSPYVSALAAELGVTQPTLTESARAAEAKGLVERHPDPDDARRSVLGITPQGREVVGRTRRVDHHLIDAIAALPQATQERALEILLEVIASLVDRGAITVARTCLTCTYHRLDGSTHHCTLLNADLPVAELRVNCPEHLAM